MKRLRYTTYSIQRFKEKEQIIVSERDSQIFFNAITKPQKPSDTLKKALDDYNSFLSNSK